MADLSSFFKKSLINHRYRWIIESHGAADRSWVTYYSPDYYTKDFEGRMSFQVDNLNFGACAFVNGFYEKRFWILPLSRTWWNIQRMKRAVKKKEYQKKEIYIQKVLAVI